MERKAELEKLRQILSGLESGQDIEIEEAPLLKESSLNNRNSLSSIEKLDHILEKLKK